MRLLKWHFNRREYISEGIYSTVAKVSGSGAEGARFKFRYDLVKDHLPVKLALRVLT